jgi:hypothetical protein
LRKRPGDVLAYFELGDLLAAEKQDDAALFNFQKTLALARILPDPSKPVAKGETMTAAELIDRAKERIAKLDKSLSEGLTAADAALAASALETAKSYADQKFPLIALRLLDQAQTSMGISPELGKLRAEIAASSHADTLRWRRIPITSDLAGWEINDGWKAKGDAISATSKGPSFAYWSGDLPEHFRFEVTVDASTLGAKSMMGLVFGAGGPTVQMMSLYSDGDIEALALKKGLAPVKHLGHVEKDLLAAVTLMVDVSKDKVEFFIDGKSVHTRAYPPEDLEGQVGLVTFNGSGQFHDIKTGY